jgi:hypothetical protein
MLATEKQVNYCKSLFKKVKIYYKCCKTDEELIAEVKERTGFDLATLTSKEAQQIIDKLTKELKNQRG